MEHTGCSGIMVNNRLSYGYTSPSFYHASKISDFLIVNSDCYKGTLDVLGRFS